MQVKHVLNTDHGKRLNDGLPSGYRGGDYSFQSQAPYRLGNWSSARSVQAAVWRHPTWPSVRVSTDQEARPLLRALGGCVEGTDEGTAARRDPNSCSTLIESELHDPGPGEVRVAVTAAGRL